MARTTGPLMSLSASGSIAGTLTYAHWRGRPYVRQLVTPSNPNTGPQIGVRAMMKFLSQGWQDVSTVDQSTWETLAKAGQYSEFNAYVKANLKRWRDFMAPSQAYPPQVVATYPALGTETATGGVRQVNLSQVLTTRNDGWGFAICRSETTGFTPAFNNTIAILDIRRFSDGDTMQYLDTPLDPGTYYYRFGACTTDGQDFDFLGSELTATVT